MRVPGGIEESGSRTVLLWTTDESPGRGRVLGGRHGDQTRGESLSHRWRFAGLPI
jgi:hypothetical protein